LQLERVIIKRVRP
jgi:hypothetical protein